MCVCKDVYCINKSLNINKEVININIDYFLFNIY